MNELDLDAIQELAKLARAETFRPGWPYGGSGEWTDNVIGMLGGATGNFAGAMSPDVVDALIARIRDLEAQLATPPAITGSVSFDGRLCSWPVNVRNEYIGAQGHTRVHVIGHPQEKP